MNQDYLTVKEIASVLKVPLSWVYSRTRQTGPGTIPKIMVGKYVRFRLSEVMDWLEKQNEDEGRYSNE